MSLKIDIHTHILPQHLPDWAAKFGYGDFITLKHHKPCYAQLYLGDKMFREIGENTWDPEVRTKECDRHGVKIQALSTVPVMFNYWAKPQDTLDISRYLNDHIASVVRDYPSRFVGLATVPLQAPEMAIRELERAVQDLGMCGVQIGSHINQWNLDEPQLMSFFETAENLQAAIFVHPWDMMGKQQMPNYWLPWLVGMPAETSLAICSMIFGGVFEKYPKLKVAFAHGGGAFPGTIGRIEHGFNVRPDLCAINNDVNPRDYLGKFYIDSLVHDRNTLHFLMDLVGVNRIALGSDYPFPLGEHIPGKLIESLLIDEQAKARLLAGTAIEFLGLEENILDK